jgi:hypothetical protein
MVDSLIGSSSACTCSIDTPSKSTLVNGLRKALCRGSRANSLRTPAPTASSAMRSAQPFFFRRQQPTQQAVTAMLSESEHPRCAHTPCRSIAANNESVGKSVAGKQSKRAAMLDHCGCATRKHHSGRGIAAISTRGSKQRFKKKYDNAQPRRKSRQCRDTRSTLTLKRGMPPALP